MNDVLLNEDLRIENGDFVIGDATAQLVRHVLRAHQSNYKNAPLVGAGVELMKGGELTQRIKREIRVQLSSQGVKVRRVTFDEGGLNVEIK